MKTPSVILLPVAWIVAVLIASALLPLWNIAVESVNPDIAPLLSNPLTDVFLRFILPSVIVWLGFIKIKKS